MPIKPLVAVTGYNPLRLYNLKQKALLFDTIADVSLAGHRERLAGVDKELSAELEWLLDRGIVVEATAGSLGLASPLTAEMLESARTLLSASDFGELTNALAAHQDAYDAYLDDGYRHLRHADAPRPSGRGRQTVTLSMQVADGRWIEVDPEHNERVVSRAHFDLMPKYLRLTALRIRLLQDCDAVVLPDEYYYDRPTPADLVAAPIGDGRNPVLDVVLKAVPLPDEATVPWEQIEEFRNDAASRDALLRLRDWMTDLGRGKLPEAEVSQKLESLLEQFARTLDLHRMKTTMGTVEALVVTSAEAIESIVKLRLGKAAEALFSARRRRVDLLQAERTGPGSAVAYIFKARDRFGRPE